MPTRFKPGAENNFGVNPVPSGYENSGVGATTLEIPSCGVEDVDIAVFELFDKEIGLSVIGVDSQVIKVPVIFAAGEKWALLKNNRPLRDRNNTLILPLITIMRTDITQTASDDINGRGINPHIGEIVVRRRLDKSDRSYQSLVNRLMIPNQDNLMTTYITASGSQPSTDRALGSLTPTEEYKDGAYLRQDRLNNVYETIVIPTPQFYTAKYQVTIWTQYTQHANQIVEKMFSSLLPQGQCWKLTTSKGYWFVARLEDGSLASESTFDDMSQQERFIKHTFEITVPAYFFATKSPGGPIPIKRYVSSPFVTFETVDVFSTSVESQSSKYVLGSDDPTLPIDEQRNIRRDQRAIGWRTQKVYPAVPDGEVFDPAISKKQNDPAVKKKSQGETVYSGASLGGLKIILAGLNNK